MKAASVRDGSPRVISMRGTRVLVAGLATIMAWCLSGPLQGQTGPWTGGPTGPIYYTGGNVGIGTTNPGWKFQVLGPSNDNLVTAMNSVSGHGSFFELGVNGQTAELQGDSAGNFFLGHYGIVGNVFQSVRAGAVANTLVLNAGNVGIGTTSPQYKLAVNGTIQAKEVLVNTGWADYVFAPNYRLRDLSEVSGYIRRNHHLPDIPSESEVKVKGVSLGDMQAKLLAKVEELTLHMIQEHERNNRLEHQNQKLRERVERIEGRDGNGEAAAEEQQPAKLQTRIPLAARSKGKQL